MTEPDVASSDATNVRPHRAHGDSHAITDANETSAGIRCKVYM